MFRFKFFVAVGCIAVLGGFVISCVHLADSSVLRQPAGITESERLALKFKLWEPDPKDLSMEELKAILQKNQFSRIEDLLSYLRQNKPEYMSHYTVMANSLSLHESSPENPRVIIYGQSANFIITFNGHPSQEAYRMLEVMQFDPLKKEFKFQEIEFKEESEIQKSYSISKVNGPDDKCLACHSNSRPIWNAYPIWPGAYGGIDDEGPGRSVAPDRGFKNLFGDNYTQTAAKKWANFQSAKNSNSRYRQLPNLASSTFFKKAYDLKVYSKSYDIPRPNSDLNIALGTHNYERIARVLKSAVAGDDIQYALLYIYSRCWMTQLPGPNPGKEILRALATKFEKKASAVKQNFLSGSLRQLAKDQDTPWREIVDNINSHKYYSEDRFSANSEDELFSSLPKAVRLDLPGSDVDSLISVLEAQVPKAQVETWPMQVYEGVYNFETGDEPFQVYLKYLMFNRVFEPAYLASYPDLEQNLEWGQIVQKCHELDQRMLPRLRQPTKN